MMQSSGDILTNVLKLSLSGRFRQQWGAAAQWAWFTAIMGFLWSAIVVFTIVYHQLNAPAGKGGWPMKIIAAELIQVGIVMLGCWILLAFSKTARRVLQNRDGALLAQSFRWVHHFFKMVSIGLMVTLALLITLGLVVLAR